MLVYEEEDLIYLEKLFKHKANVVRAYSVLSNNIIKTNDKDLFHKFVSCSDKLKDLVLRHDNTKLEYGFEFFKSYRSRHIKSVMDFDLSKDKVSEDVKKHRGMERHHPDYWKVISVEMTTVHLFEMACDWLAVSLTEPDKSTPFEYLQKNIESLGEEFGGILDIDLFTRIIKVISGVDNIIRESGK